MNDAKPDVASLPANHVRLRELCHVISARGPKNWPEDVLYELRKELEAALAKPASGDGLLATRDAWFAVCDALDQVDPDWMMHGPVGVEAAVATIRRLATPDQPKCPECDKWLTGYCNSCAANVAEQPGSSVQGEAKPIVWIEQSVHDDLVAEKPWTIGANNVFCQRKVGKYTVPLYTTSQPSPAAEQGEECQHVWQADKDAEGWSYCPKCDCSRRLPATQSEYFPDGSDSPIRDEARGVEQDESIARRIDRVVFDPMRVADKTRKERQPETRAAEHGKCDLGVGCDEAGVCYALANGHPEQCGRGFQPETRMTEGDKITAQNEAFDIAESMKPEARGVEGMVLVPKELAERVMDALVRFTGDEGWTMPDMDVADALGATLATPNPVRAEQPARLPLAYATEKVAKELGIPVGTALWDYPAAPGVRVDEAMAERLRIAFYPLLENIKRCHIKDALTTALATDGGEEE